MFNRTILNQLLDWASGPDRKPLILRGARQVGKTSLVNIFSKNFDHYIYLNLDRIEDKAIFERDYPFESFIDALFFYRNKEKNAGKTLIFIDEIQNSSRAVSYLRYFYEVYPELYVIAAGSLLESLIDNQISFPVGRVEYLAVRPCSFVEFLAATGENKALELLDQIFMPEYAHNKLEDLFNRYCIIGGMPEIIKNYAKYHDLVKLEPIYDALITSYLDDVEKYAHNSTMKYVVRHIITSSFGAASERITFERFGNSNYRSREVGEAFRILEKAIFLQLVFPVVNQGIPMDIKLRTPKLQLLDTGLLNHLARIKGELLGSNSIEAVYRGKIAEHIVGQELLSSNSSVQARLYYWLRDSRNSQAEVDFVLPYKGYLIPVEVKSGSTGKLRSLHLFMDKAEHRWAVRVYSGKLHVEEVKSSGGRAYSLINVPFYLVGRIEGLLDNIIK